MRIGAYQGACQMRPGKLALWRPATGGGTSPIGGRKPRPDEHYALSGWLTSGSRELPGGKSMPALLMQRGYPEEEHPPPDPWPPDPTDPTEPPGGEPVGFQPRLRPRAREWVREHIDEPGAFVLIGLGDDPFFKLAQAGMRWRALSSEPGGEPWEPFVRIGGTVGFTCGLAHGIGGPGPCVAIGLTVGVTEETIYRVIETAEQLAYLTGQAAETARSAWEAYQSALSYEDDRYPPAEPRPTLTPIPAATPPPPAAPAPGEPQLAGFDPYGDPLPVRATPPPAAPAPGEPQVAGFDPYGDPLPAAAAPPPATPAFAEPQVAGFDPFGSPLPAAAAPPPQPQGEWVNGAWIPAGVPAWVRAKLLE